MTSTRDSHSPTRLEIVVLARMSVSKLPSEKDLVDATLAFALPNGSRERARDMVVEALEALRAHGLVNVRRRALTEDGSRTLRETFGLARTPAWRDVRDKHLPARALGLVPGSKQATEVLREADSIAAAVLRNQLGIREASTLPALCDALVVEDLGLPPGPITIARIRSHVLARRLGGQAKGDPIAFAARAAATAMRAPRADKRSMVQALGRRWVSEDGASAGTQSLGQPATPVTDDELLALVREAIPLVGAEGRFGAEKVFVSAIWSCIEGDRRLAGLSLDRFKSWLVTANRDGWLVLARADLVGAMNAELVAGSEIKDRGATFHFVLDPRAEAPEEEWESHAR